MLLPISGGDPHGPCDTAGGPSTASATFGGLDYAVVGGLSGQGDGTTLHIAADGAFSRYTPQRGDEQGMLDPAALQDLVGRARAAEFSRGLSRKQEPGRGAGGLAAALSRLLSLLSEPPSDASGIASADRYAEG